jgi:hypothetical protein
MERGHPARIEREARILKVNDPTQIGLIALHARRVKSPT